MYIFSLLSRCLNLSKATIMFSLESNEPVDMLLGPISLLLQTGRSRKSEIKYDQEYKLVKTSKYD